MPPALADRKNTQVVRILSEPPRDWKGQTGQIGCETIENEFAFDGAGEWLYLLCGPPAMLDAIEDALIALYVPAGRVVSERFYYD